MNPKISIILPCYNGELFIEKTINSVINQTYKNWECILINDGSKDNSLQVIQNITINDSRFKVIDQENKGLSITRNIGLSIATGDFVYFLDSDDLISKDCLEKLSSYVTPELDIITGVTATTLGQNENIYDYLNHSIEENKVLVNTDLEIIKTAVNKGITCIAQNRLFSKQFLDKNALKFKEKIYHEDELFFFETYYHANKVIFISDVTYFYNVDNTASITKNKKAKNIIDYLSITEEIYNKYYLSSLDTKKEAVALFLTNFKRLIFYHLNQCTEEEQNKVKDLIEKTFSQTKIQRSKKILSSKFEKKLFMFHVFSFENVETIKKFLFLNSKKNILFSIYKKALFVFYKNKNKKNIQLTYDYSKLK